MIGTNDLTTRSSDEYRLKSGASSIATALCGTKALVLIPGTVNYFYNVEGKRLAEALRNLGSEVDVGTIDSYEGQRYDWCFLLNIYEIDFAHGNRATFLQQIRKLKNNCNRVVPTLLESVHTKWFADSYDLMIHADLENILDLGFEDQRNRLPEPAQRAYDFTFNGLTNSERQVAESLQSAVEERSIPWTFVGQATLERLSLVERLVLDYDPAGFVYLVRHVPYTETGPHLKEQQLEQVLQRTRYKIWCSHHKHTYLESIRFRLALMSGCIPIKVSLQSQVIDDQAPFNALIMNESSFIDRIRSLDFSTARQAFVEEYFALPSLEASILKLITQWGRA